jgi:hypothetical protein
MMEIPIPDVEVNGVVFRPTPKTDTLASRVYQVWVNLDMLSKSPGFVDYCQTVRDLEADVTKIADVLPDILAELMVADIINARAENLREKVEIAWNTWVKAHVLDSEYFKGVSK